MAHRRPRPPAPPRPAPTCRSSPSGTSGCTSRGWARYDAEHRVPIIARGEGAYVYDEHGNRYLDGLSGLFCVNAGHGRAEIGEAMARQVARARLRHQLELRAPARDRARRRGSPTLAPGDLNRVFFTSGGSEAVESAIKLARALPPRTGQRPEAQVHRPRGRLPRDHDGRAAGDRDHRPAHRLRAARPRAGVTSRTRTATTGPTDRDPLWAADQIEERIEFEGPETVAAVILEPLQNAGGCIPPQEGYFQRVREICDRHDVLLISDEVICAWGRLGHYFGCERYGYQPDIITTAKALTSAYAPMGAMIASDRVYEPFSEGHRVVRPRVHLRRPPGRRRGRDGQPRHLRARGPLRPRAARRRASSAAMLDGLRDIPIVGDVRGDGFFHAIELVKDQETKEGVHRRGVRVAAARLPLRRALPARADLPRRRPRRPRDPARAAADLRHRAVRGDRRRPARRC